MQQLTQKLKKGEIEIREVPVPAVAAGQVLVRNHFSLISAGTEGSTVKTARKSLIGKAKERPQQVKQVLDVLRSQGPVQTYRAVMKKLDAYSPLGYSCAGEVIEVGPDVEGFQIGDKVACAGITASHAEIVQAPVNLCVKLDSEADLKSACYNTLGAIAMQGIRLAEIELGAKVTLDTTELTLTDERFSAKTFATGTVTYSDGETAQLLYVKAVVSGDSPLRLQRYAATDPKFPNYGTLNQLLGAEPLEHLIHLGHHSMGQALDENPAIVVSALPQ